MVQMLCISALLPFSVRMAALEDVSHGKEQCARGQDLPPVVASHMTHSVTLTPSCSCNLISHRRLQAVSLLWPLTIEKGRLIVV